MDRDQLMIRVALAMASQTKVGAIIVDESGHIISSGFNDRPRGCENFSIGKEWNWKYSVHAEMNAILRCNPRGCTIYVSKQPCTECSKLIVRSGITRVVYMEGDISHPLYWENSLDILKDAAVDIRVLPRIEVAPNNSSLDVFMMELAKMIGEQNETNEENVGALIVDSTGRHIVSSGYPRKPKGCQRNGSHHFLPCGRLDVYAIHADADAILGRDVKGCTLYLSKYPCNASARMISMSGIARVVLYKNDLSSQHEHDVALQILEAGGVQISSV